MKKIYPCLSIIQTSSNSYNFHLPNGKIKRPTIQNKIIKKKSKWKYQKNHYKMYCQTLASNPKELNRILKFKNEIENVNFSFSTHNVDQILDALVEFVNVITQFYDNGKIKYLSNNITRNEFNELYKTYKISIVMTSISGWKKGKVTSLDKKIKYVDLNPLAILMNSCQKKLLQICDELISN